MKEIEAKIEAPFYKSLNSLCVSASLRLITK